MRTIQWACAVLLLIALRQSVLGDELRLVESPAVESRTSCAEENAANDYEKHCQMMGSEVLKRIAPPFPESRLAYYLENEKHQARAIPRAPDNIFFRWDEGKLTRWGMSFGGANLTTILRMLTELYPQDIVGDEDLKTLKIPGDFVISVNAPQEKVVARLEQILNQEMKLNIRLAFREIEREVYVARGTYEFVPIDKDRERVEIYGDKLNKNPSIGGGGSGNFQQLLDWVGMWIEQPVISEVESPPDEEISWHYNLDAPFTDEEQRIAKDPQRVLRNLSQQTGLKFTREAKLVRVLVVERQKDVE